MIVVGLTGGIGSGKTTVGSFFAELNVPIYIADDEAKQLMRTSTVIKKQLIKLFGEDTYQDQELNRPFIASKIFNNKQLLKQMNAIVHPKVAAHFKRWLKKQKTAYVIKEAAIIFEHHMEDQYDLIITVIANKEARIERVIARDDSNRAKIESVIENQLDDAIKIKKSHYVIENNDLDQTKIQVENTHQSILNHIKNLKI
ncbi:MAG: dephospho-CoA kinase [Psychroserpens sp.]|uniref:dephospho-CoA kinase n=1 Tax=Psychroserpens sp. TaxID=2020870 RepID=UPI003C762171